MANQGDGSRVLVDLTRWEHEEMDISGQFNARAGDTQDFVPMWVRSNGFPQDVRKWGLVYGGTDANMVPHRHEIECIGDLPLNRGDQPAVGKFTLPFDERTFNVPGKWNQFFVQFIDENGETVSTIDLGFDVFDNSFFAHMGDAENIYVEEFEKILQTVTNQGEQTTEEIKNTGESFKTDFNTWITNYKQALNDAMSAVNDPKDGLYVRYSQLLEMTNQIQETLKQAQFHDRPFQLSTVADMKAYAPLMAGDVVITQGWDNYDDGHGTFWNIRVKHKDETPDENNVLSLDNGMVAERNSSLISADTMEDLLYGYTIEIHHGQDDFPARPVVMYYEDAIGIEANGLGTGSAGFGQAKTKLLPFRAEYPDANTIKLLVPRNFCLKVAPHYIAGAWYLVDDNLAIKVDLGSVDDAEAMNGEGQNRSYLSAGTGFFAKPTSPSDLRAVYIDENTQRLLWRM